MQVGGILETALSVANPAKSAAFYQRIFGFGALLETERLVALDVAGRNVLVLFPQGGTHQPFATPGGLIPAHGASGQSHLAFSIARDDLPAWELRLANEGVVTESTVHWPQGATSLYFRDPDQHLVELITPGFWSIY